MKSVTWACLAILVAFAGASGPVAAADDKPKPDREGGIIGTGIVGTITELGSIIVNGVHVSFSANFQAETPFGTKLASALIPGETVVVEAHETTGGIEATRIATYLPIIGPLRQDPDGTWRIMGTEVVTSDATLSGAPGDWAAVNGLWQGGRLIASRVTFVPPQPHATIIGTYWGGTTDGFTLGETIIEGAAITHARMGDVITVQGQPDAGSLAAERVSIGLFSGPVDTLLIEGFLGAPDASGVYTVHGAGLVAYTDNPGMVPTAPRGLFCIDQTRATPIRRIDPPHSTDNPCAD